MKHRSPSIVLAGAFYLVAAGASFGGARVEQGSLRVTVPAKSIIVLREAGQ